MQLFLMLCVSVLFGVESLSVAKMDTVKGDDHQCGVEASYHLIHHNPWTVFLEYYTDDEREFGQCGGTLIGRRHVVTAAHCVRRFTFTRIIARLGEYDLSTKRDYVQGVWSDEIERINVVKIFVPDTYDGKNDDIAVLELEKDAPYTDFIRPVCLPTGKIQDGVIFSAAGWGQLTNKYIYSSTKKIIPLPYWSRKDCKNAYKDEVLPRKIICAGGEENIDTCKGDSGGPLTWNKGKIELWGVISLGNVRCGTKGTPGIYTSVIDHLDWIKSVSKI